MVNYLEVTPKVHTGGSPTVQDLQNLRAAGVEVVINLALNTSPDAIPDEAGVVARLGMRYIHIPVEWSAPMPANLRDFFAALDGCQGCPIFIHCVKNMRVSAFLYLYRVIRQGVNPEEAFYDMAQIWEPEGVWANFVENALNSNLRSFDPPGSKKAQ
jgi:protein tyrosine phosphatase (PTP) superfamily phosphohydrolase (DUF442 family)